MIDQLISCREIIVRGILNFRKKIPWRLNHGTQPLLVSEFVAKYINKDLSRPLSDQDRVKFLNKVFGYLIALISRFPLETGEEKSVMQCYREKYNVDIVLWNEKMLSRR